MNGLVSLSQRFLVAFLSLMKRRGFYFKDWRSFDPPRWFLQTRNSPTLNLNSMSEIVLSCYMAIFRIGAFHLPLPRRRRRMKYVLGWRSINQVFFPPSPVLKSVAEQRMCIKGVSQEQQHNHVKAKEKKRRCELLPPLQNESLKSPKSPPPLQIETKRKESLENYDYE